MDLQTRHWYILFFGGFLFIADQYLKWLVQRTEPALTQTPLGAMGWDFFANPGIAFSLPVANAFIVFATPIILLLLFVFFYSHQQQSLRWLFGVTLLFAGALSNYIDRVLFEATIDYLRIGTAVINVADIMIVAGAILLVLSNKTECKDITK